MKFFTLTVLIVLALNLIGCGDGDLGKVDAPPPKVEDSIANIESNPHMPQQAKDAAIGQLKAREAQGKAMAEAAKGGQKPGP